MDPPSLTTTGRSGSGKVVLMKALALISLPLLLTNCMVVDFASQQGNGIAVTEARSLSSFTRVDLECPIHVVIKSGPQYAAYVTSDDNLSGYIQTDAFGGVLTIGLAGQIEPVVVPEVIIVVPDIREVIHNGDGLVELEEGGDFPDLTLQLNGGGEIRFSGTASTLRTELNGTGKITVDGFAALLKADLRGNGAIFAQNLLVEDADVALSGSGNVYLDMDYESTLNLALTGSGNVEWWGAPQTLNYTLTGVGKVVEHKGLPKKAAAMMGSAKAGAAKSSADAGKPYEIIAAKK
jgi:hypothetical protein